VGRLIGEQLLNFHNSGSFDYKGYHAKYPSLDKDEVVACLALIRNVEFTTIEFIGIWEAKFPVSAARFRSVGGRWKPALGGKLSEFAHDTGKIERVNVRGNDGQVWKKL
jgi:hypothetical protein